MFVSGLFLFITQFSVITDDGDSCTEQNDALLTEFVYHG